MSAPTEVSTRETELLERVRKLETIVAALAARVWKDSVPGYQDSDFLTSEQLVRFLKETRSKSWE